VLVIIAAIRLRLPYSIFVGATMGAFSSYNWHEVVMANGGALTAWSYANYFTPRIAIPIVVAAVDRAVRSWRIRGVGLAVVAFAGTATNTVVYSAILLARLVWVPGDGELPYRELTPWGVAHIARANTAIEIVFAVVAVVGINYVVWRVQGDRGAAPTSSASSESSAGTAGCDSVYICYPDTDAGVARRLHEGLTAREVGSFCAAASVPVGADWLGARQGARATARVYVVLDSGLNKDDQDFVNEREACLALAHEARRRAILVCKPGVSPHGTYFATIELADFSDVQCCRAVEMIRHAFTSARASTSPSTPAQDGKSAVQNDGSV
jgi:hypothetical protein